MSTLLPQKSFLVPQNQYSPWRSTICNKCCKVFCSSAHLKNPGLCPKIWSVTRIQARKLSSYKENCTDKIFKAMSCSKCYWAKHSCNLHGGASSNEKSLTLESRVNRLEVDSMESHSCVKVLFQFDASLTHKINRTFLYLLYCAQAFRCSLNICVSDTLTTPFDLR